MKLADKFRKSRFAWTLSDFEQVTTKAFEPVHTAQGMQHRGYHGRMTQMLKKHRAKKHAIPIVTMMLKGFDASQPRWPKGSPKGGQWKHEGSGAKGPLGNLLRISRGPGGISMLGTRYTVTPDRKAPFETPLGKKLSTNTARNITLGAELIDKVLNLPKRPLLTRGRKGVSVEIRPADSSARGAFYQNRGHIEVAMSRENKTATFVHEVGHLLDSRLLGGALEHLRHNSDSMGDFAWSERYTKRASFYNTLASTWWKAVKTTQSYAYHRLADANGYYVSRKGKKLVIDFFMKGYFSSAKEMFARSFVQYVALKTFSPTLLKAITRDLRSSSVKQYWDWQDFKPIVDAFDELFAAQNLLKEYNPGQPRWGKGNPRGGQWKSSVSGELLTGGRQRIARQVIQAAEKRHGRLPAHTVRVTRRLGRGTEGDYSSGHIRLSASTQLPALETAHEVGHLLDHRRFGTPFPSVNDKRMAGWRKAVDRSALTSRWRAWRTIGHIALGGNRYFVRPQVFRYALDRREQFARSYAQWLARKAGGRLRRELRIAQNRPVTYYWNDRDFGRIERELDKVFANG